MAATWKPRAEAIRRNTLPRIPLPGCLCGSIRVSAGPVDYISQKARGEHSHALQAEVLETSRRRCTTIPTTPVGRKFTLSTSEWLCGYVPTLRTSVTLSRIRERKIFDRRDFLSKCLQLVERVNSEIKN